MDGHGTPARATTPPNPTLWVVACGLVDRDGRVLMTQRPPGKEHAGLWEFPGGKIEPGETPEAALVRELREELAVSTEESCLAPFTFGTHRRHRGSLVMLLFLCRKWDGIARPEEGQAMRWVAPPDLLALDMPPVDRPMAAQLRDFLMGY